MYSNNEYIRRKNFVSAVYPFVSARDRAKKCDPSATSADYCNTDRRIAAAVEVFRVERLGPAGVVKRLGYYFAGCLGSLQRKASKGDNPGWY